MRCHFPRAAQAALVLAAAATQSYGEPPLKASSIRVRKMQDLVIYKDNKFYSSFPSIVRRSDGELLVAQAQWLPQYAPDILAARERLADHERNGTRVKLCNTKGAARLHTKSVEELARDKEDARANASAADKGKMTVAK